MKPEGSEPIWAALTIIWVTAFLINVLVVTSLNSLTLIGTTVLGLTVILLATVRWLRDLSPDAEEQNWQLLLVFVMMGLMNLLVFSCLLIVQVISGG